jgi:riboflavin biosynthesis pyrimidine reductase
VGNKHWIALGSQDYLQNFMTYCQENAIQSILIEGGTKTIEAFMQEILVQEIIHIESDDVLGSGISAPYVEEIDARKYTLGSDNRWIIQLSKENLA